MDLALRQQARKPGLDEAFLVPDVMEDAEGVARLLAPGLAFGGPVQRLLRQAGIRGGRCEGDLAAGIGVPGATQDEDGGAGRLTAS